LTIWNHFLPVGVVGDDEKVQGPRQLCRLPARRHYFLTAGKTVRLTGAEPRAERTRIKRGRRVQMRIAEQRTSGKFAPGIGRVDRLGGKYSFSGVLVYGAGIIERAGGCLGLLSH
jgi:hypothetical protein